MLQRYEVDVISVTVEARHIYKQLSANSHESKKVGLEIYNNPYKKS